MHKKETRGWLKHIDFILLDIVMLQICFVLSYWIWMGVENPYVYYLYRYQAMLLMFCQLLVVLFTDSYKNIFGYVPSEKWIFEGTIAENIGYGLDEYDLEDVKKACEAIGFDEIIESKPDLVLTVDSPGFAYSVIKKLRYCVNVLLLHNNAVAQNVHSD